MTPDLRRRIAERAYFLAEAGIGRDDVDRWLVAEARENEASIKAGKPTELLISDGTKFVKLHVKLLDLSTVHDHVYAPPKAKSKRWSKIGIVSE